MRPHDRSRTNSPANIGIAILAAGASTRLGQPKQLVPYQGVPLLQRIISESEQLHAVAHVVVLGANSDLIRSHIDFGPFEVVQNSTWEDGMSSSIHLAIEFAETHQLDGLLVLLTDQPQVDSKLLVQLMQLYEPETKCIVACAYGETLGVPALFDRHYFQDLRQLKGDTGARKLLQIFREKVKAVKFEQGSVDIDTPADLANLNALENGDHS